MNSHTSTRTRVEELDSLGDFFKIGAQLGYGEGLDCLGGVRRRGVYEHGQSALHAHIKFSKN